MADTIYDALDEDMVNKLSSLYSLELSEFYIQDIRRLVAEHIGREVSAIERERVLSKLADNFSVTLYTASEVPRGLKNKGLKICGYIDYDTVMPMIFRDSRINLNITSKNIESGVPLRVMDILACGGFCMTNYQPEIAEYFEDGVELSMYSDMDELVEKCRYYLSHEDERRQIALNGYRKVSENFTLAINARIMLGGIGAR